MDYAVSIERSAERELKSLPADVVPRLAPRLRDLAREPRPVQSKRLRGSAFYRLRVGDYRAIYSVDDEARTVTILAVGHRRDVYRDQR